MAALKEWQRMSDNWVCGNLENALEVWNSKIVGDLAADNTVTSDIQRWLNAWSVIVNVHGALKPSAMYTTRAFSLWWVL